LLSAGFGAVSELPKLNTAGFEAAAPKLNPPVAAGASGFDAEDPKENTGATEEVFLAFDSPVSSSLALRLRDDDEAPKENTGAADGAEVVLVPKVEALEAPKENGVAVAVVVEVEAAPKENTGFVVSSTLAAEGPAKVGMVAAVGFVVDAAPNVKRDGVDVIGAVEADEAAVGDVVEPLPNWNKGAVFVVVSSLFVTAAVPKLNKAGVVDVNSGVSLFSFDFLSSFNEAFSELLDAAEIDDDPKMGFAVEDPKLKVGVEEVSAVDVEEVPKVKVAAGAVVVAAVVVVEFPKVKPKAGLSATTSLL